MRLFFRIFSTSLELRISLFPAQKKKSLFRLNQKVILKRKTDKKDKIFRYVSLYSRLLGKLGFRNTCLTRSALLCLVLRKLGYDAQVNFGIPINSGKNNLDPSFQGHCWVNIAGDNFMEGEYETIHKYPLDQS